MSLPKPSFVLVYLFLITAGLSLSARADSQDNSSAPANNPVDHPDAESQHCPGSLIFRNFLSDSAGPYPIFMGLATAGIHQATDNPPDWHQGFRALSERFGSNMGITVIGNSARYGISCAMNVDTRFEKCHCTKFWPRMGHVIKSTAMARRRASGSFVLAVPNFVAPYVATTAAVYAWYPQRYGVKDALRMGNYNLLGTLGGNIAFEFIPTKVQKFLHRHHLSGSRSTDD